MAFRPALNGFSCPYLSDGKICLGSREVVIRRNELVDSLLRNAEHFGDLGDAHKTICHEFSVEETLAYRQQIGYT